MTPEDQGPVFGLDDRLGELVDAAGRSARVAPAPLIRRRGQQRVTRQRLAAAILVAAVVAGGLLGARWALPVAQTDLPAVPVIPATSAAPTHTAASPSAAVTAPASTTAPPNPTGTSPSTVRCRGPQLVVGTGGSDSASGHRALVLLFTNHGGTPCHLKGYPGVAALDTSGTQVAQAQRTLGGYMGGASSTATVLLRPGQAASALVEALAYNPSDGSACTPWAGLLVTAPDDTASTRLPWTSDGCAQLEIHPVVPGSTGLG